MTDIKRVGVLGCGLMGSGIAQVAATAGYETIVRDVAPEVWSRARQHREVARQVRRERQARAGGPRSRPEAAQLYHRRR
jgi:3-hydroxybutyryl-CoA dehydrogenase